MLTPTPPNAFESSFLAQLQEDGESLTAAEAEPLFHLGGEPDPHSPLPGGYPVLAVFGEQGPAVCGWLPRYQPEIVAALHLLEGLVRSPQALAEVLGAAGSGALTQVGRILAAPPQD